MVGIKSSMALRGVLGFCALIAVAACGGGESSSAPKVTVSASVTPTPTPSPTPTPTPTPAPSFSLAQSPFLLGQSASQDFVTLGFSYRAEAGAWESIPDPTSLNSAVPIGVRLVAPAGLRLAIGGLGESTVQPNGGGGTDQAGRIVQLGFSAFGGAGSLVAGLAGDGRPLASTALGFLQLVDENATRFDLFEVVFAYGLATPAADVPKFGVAAYRHLSREVAMDVDFAAATVSGSMADEQGRTVTLREVALSADRTAFAGKLTVSGTKDEGTIDGRLTGPTAREAMVRMFVPVSGGRAGRIVVLGRI